VARIFILGGTGGSGSLIARHILEQSDAEITIAGRRRQKAQQLADDLSRLYPGRVAVAALDAADQSALRAAAAGHSLLVIAAPLTAQTEKMARFAIAAGLDWFDLQLGSRKLAVLKSLAGEIERAGRCFITEAGFHPGLPSALVRYAAAHLDVIESAVTAGYLGFNREIPYSEAVDELMEVFKDYQAQIYKDGRWTRPGAWQMRRIDFGGDIGIKRCFSMFFEELRDLPAMYPTLRDVGFFISESHWVTDWIVTPTALVLLKLLPRAKRTLGKFVWWGMMTFRRPPFRVELVVQAAGRQAGQPTEFAAAVSHPDAYEMTAIPAVAALMQYLDGSARQPGLHLMGHLADPARLMTDMKRMGVKFRMASN